MFQYVDNPTLLPPCSPVGVIGDQAPRSRLDGFISYDAGTGVATFTSDDGLGFSTTFVVLTVLTATASL